MNNEKSTLEIIREALKFQIQKIITVFLLLLLFGIVSAGGLIVPLLIPVIIQKYFLIPLALILCLCVLLALSPFKVGINAYILAEKGSFSLIFSPYKKFMDIIKLRLAVFFKVFVYSLRWYIPALLINILLGLLMYVCQLHDLLSFYMLLTYAVANVMTLIKSYSYYFSDLVFIENDGITVRRAMEISDTLTIDGKGRIFALSVFPAVELLLLIISAIILGSCGYVIAFLFGAPLTVYTSVFTAVILSIVIINVIILMPVSFIATTVLYRNFQDKLKPAE